jgi:hypothetical protein
LSEKSLGSTWLDLGAILVQVAGTMTRFRVIGALMGAALLASSAGAFAQTEGEKAPEATSPVPTQGGAAGTTVVAPPGSGGITVVAPTPGGGTVTATGCTSVVVNGAPTLIGPGGAPCPTYPAYAPYAPPPPPTMPYYDVRPRYAHDSERKAALIGSAIGFGVGGGIAGIMYLVQYTEERDRCNDYRYVRYSDGTSRYEKDSSGCGGGAARASLITYGAIVTFLPSIPRFVVGDTTKGLIYTGLRGVSFATAALVNWGDNGDTRWQGPFLLGFVAPITLGIIDLATTPHREDLVEKEKAGITGISPVALADKQGKTHGALLAVEGLF